MLSPKKWTMNFNQPFNNCQMSVNECTCSDEYHCKCGCHCDDDPTQTNTSIPVVTDEDEKFLLDNLDDWD